jgi:hypothetical protein
MRYAPLHRLHSRELCLLRIRARARAWAGVAAPAPEAFPVFAKGWPAWAAACMKRAAGRTREAAGGRADGCGSGARDLPAQPPEPRPQPHVVPKVAAAAFPMEGFFHAHALKT